MQNDQGKSLLFSQIGVAVFAALLLALDLGGYWAVGWLVRLRGIGVSSGLGMLGTVYVGSVFAWLLLFRMWRLLGNLRRAQVFVPENVELLRHVSWCCVAGALVALGGSLFYLPFLFVALAAGFMALIVRVVKNVFQQATEMKSELDLTI